jgi:hypothetical protein
LALLSRFSFIDRDVIIAARISQSLEQFRLSSSKHIPHARQPPNGFQPRRLTAGANPLDSFLQPLLARSAVVRSIGSLPGGATATSGAFPQ